jgi:hypothetical protein
LADIFTKGLVQALFEELRKMLMGWWQLTLRLRGSVTVGGTQWWNGWQAEPNGRNGTTKNGTKSEQHKRNTGMYSE